jgi:PilZ domain
VDRLRENAIVTISLPVGRTFRVSDFHATVVAIIEPGAVLHAVDVPADALPAHAEDVFLSFVHGHRLVALKGTLTFKPEGGGLRFQTQDGVHVRRSRYTRVEAELPVTLAHAGAEPSEGTTVNVAPEGLLVSSSLAVELDDVLELTLALPRYEQPLRLQAKVVRHAGGLIALHFADRRDVSAAVAEFVVERRAEQLVSA